jgi:hypothetical protein
MTTNIVNLLGRFQEAVEESDYEEANAVLDQLAEDYQQANATESALVQRYSIARSAGGVSDQGQERLNQYIQAVVEIGLRRAGALSEMQGFVAGANVDAGTLSDRITSLRNQEEKVKSRAAGASKVEITKSLPTSIIVSQFKINTSPLPKGQEAVLTAYIQNVGDKPANEIDIALTSSDGISFSQKRKASVHSLTPRLSSLR